MSSIKKLQVSFKFILKIQSSSKIYFSGMHFPDFLDTSMLNFREGSLTFDDIINLRRVDLEQFRKQFCKLGVILQHLPY